MIHPRITLAAVIVALGAIAGSCTAFVAALDPILKFPILAPYLPLIQRFDGDIVGFGTACAALASALTIVAGAGRSIVAAIDNPPKP